MKTATSVLTAAAPRFVRQSCRCSRRRKCNVNVQLEVWTRPEPFFTFLCCPWKSVNRTNLRTVSSLEHIQLSSVLTGMSLKRWNSGVVVSNIASQQEGCGSDPQLQWLCLCGSFSFPHQKSCRYLLPHFLPLPCYASVRQSTLFKLVWNKGSRSKGKKSSCLDPDTTSLINSYSCTLHSMSRDKPTSEQWQAHCQKP